MILNNIIEDFNNKVDNTEQTANKINDLLCEI